MRKLHKLVPAVTLALASSRAAAQLVYEPFDYGSASVGTRLVDSATSPTFSGLINPMSGYSWFATATSTFTTSPTIASGNLPSPAGSPASTGNSLSLAGSERGGRITINNAGGYGQSSGATIFYSMNLKVTDLTNLPSNSTGATNGSFIAGLNNSSGTQTTTPTIYGGRLMIRRGGALQDSTTTYQLGIKSVNAVQWIPTEYNVNTDVLKVVAAYQLVDSGNLNDVGSIWVNPSASDYGKSVAPAPLQSVSEDLQATATNAHIDSFVIRGDNALVPAGIVMDEIRVDTSWAQVVPPTGNTWTGTTGDSWSNPAKWSDAVVPDGASKFINLTGAGGTVNLDSARTVGTVTIKTTSPYTISGSTLTLDGDVANNGVGVINVLPNIDATGGAPPIDPVLASSHTIASNLTYNGNVAINIAKNQTLTLAGVVANAGPTAALTKNGGGTLMLTNAGNTFDIAGNNIVVNDGTVGATSDAALGPAPSTPTNKIVLNRAALRLDGSFSTNVNRNLSILGVSSGTFSSIDVTTGNTATFAGTISGNSLFKTGNGTLVLNNTGNGYTTGTTINAGVVQVSSDSNLGGVPNTTTTTNITLNGGVLQFGASFNPSNNRQVSIGAAGGTIDTNGNNASIGATIIGSGTLTKAGGGQLTLGGSNTYTGGTAITGGTLTIFNDANLGAAGSGITYNSGALKVFSSFSFSGRPMTVNAGGGTLDTNAFDVVATTVAGPGAFTKAAGGKLTVNTIRTGGLTIGGGSVELLADGTAAGVSKVGALSIDPSAKLNLQNNKVITTSAVGTWTGSDYTGVSGLIKSGRNGGGWGGNGIVTSQSTAVAGNLTTIGVATGAQVKGVAATATALFAGQTVSGSDTLVMYTYGGDANLDGKINVDDYTRIDFNVPLGVAGWYNGDFNYDGKINVDDYTIIDFNVGIQGAAFPTGSGAGLNGVSAVPEPASVTVLAFGALGLLGRRRRSRSIGLQML